MGAGQAGRAVPVGRPMPNERPALIMSMTTPFLQVIEKNGGAEPWSMPERLRRQRRSRCIPSQRRGESKVRCVFALYCIGRALSRTFRHQGRCTQKTAEGLPPSVADPQRFRREGERNALKGYETLGGLLPDLRGFGACFSGATHLFCLLETLNSGEPARLVQHLSGKRCVAPCSRSNALALPAQEEGGSPSAQAAPMASCAGPGAGRSGTRSPPRHRAGSRPPPKSRRPRSGRLRAGRWSRPPNTPHRC